MNQSSVFRLTRWGALIGSVMLVAAACSSTSTGGNAVDPADWDGVLSGSRGQELNLFMWGGSSEINRFVDTVYGPRLKAEFGIELNRIPVADTVDAVNKVLSEIQAGRDRGGAVDLIWINGENFQTLRQADALLGDWSTRIPNARFVDWDAPEVSLDFGLPVAGFESPEAFGGGSSDSEDLQAERLSPVRSWSPRWMPTPRGPRPSIPGPTPG